MGGAEINQPFNDDFVSTVARHSESKKWFALVMEYQGKTVVNLKCDPMESDFLRSVFEGVIPAYHMNKVHWNTVFLESDVPDEEIERMTLVSFELTGKRKKMPKKNGKNPL
ncbi:MAG: MmcQ/YjbR family DNA-binding protein [Oscillospiraceae bacterium]|nr:MmcQ/YjbR family DNA-binding protein [Oscillospiraceae bacterium]